MTPSDRPTLEVPPHLRPFVVDQHYEQYTPVDHAVWRYVIRCNTRSLEGRAHEAYLRYFSHTGMEFDRVPDVAVMHERLKENGWGAVVVDGFIPPSVFMDFQAHGLLPIAQDIRTLDHIGYTPAPDIIHEAAGHAPLILDPKFGALVRYIGAIGAKAIPYQEDYAVYEAIRHLSIVKEDPHATADQIQAAEAELERAIAADPGTSEATLIARLYWWAIEYGLHGDLEAPRIIGAGLLSSMSEGAECLKPHVRHLPFSLECLRYAYDITRPQPQLFVVESFDQLYEAIDAVARTMAFRVGGTESLEKAARSGRTCTAVLSSGLQVSGTFSGLELDDAGEAIFVHLREPVALAIDGRELVGYGVADRPALLGFPLGGAKGLNGALEDADDAALGSLGLVAGRRGVLELESGIRVTGLLEGLDRVDGRLVVMRWRDVQVWHGERMLRAVERFDMAVGTRVTSVFAGSADPTHFVVDVQRPRYTNPRTPANELERDLHRHYQRVRDAREGRVPEERLEVALQEVLEGLEAWHRGDWLLRVEMLELLLDRDLLPGARRVLRAELEALASGNAQLEALIARGLALLPADPGEDRSPAAEERWQGEAVA